MKFMFFLYPGIPVTPTEREARRPVARDTGLFQKMLDEVVELSQFVEDLGFDAVTFPEHHLHTEGGEMGSLPVLTQHVLMHTKRIMAGPIGYVLPGWNPLRLALETAWLDQLTKGRTFAGFARGYQARWLNQMAQKLKVGTVDHGKADLDRINREAFEEVYQVLKLAWADGPFRFKGKHYEYPTPFDAGTPWPAHEWTRKYGAPGELDEQGNIHAIEVVPKPYTKPHPPLFQAFSMSEETIKWSAREGIIPTLLVSNYDELRHFAELHRDEANAHGRSLALGESLGVFRSVYLAKDKPAARQLATDGLIGTGWAGWAHDFGFTDAFKLPGDKAQYGDGPLPREACTIERLEQTHFALVGDRDDVRRGMDAMVEAGNPEWFIWQSDQGYLPIDEVKRMAEEFARHVMPHYADSHGGGQLAKSAG
ncbi:MAG: LLM class flavin-dependent oxidoreductase [Gammaproteobacteria bacterium]|nr:LLM class flavin-dependent oxidoreductase [Gammaproteobacteria bacterium]MCP5200294.1 LLM class flavin-dependent oxidoreductase [Gammaproteobacteria bacterium]